MNNESDDDEFAHLFAPDGKSRTSWIKRPRPAGGDLKRYPDRVRLANLICTRKSRTLLGFVLHHGAVMTTERIEDSGVDFIAECRCGLAHAVDGDLLATVVGDVTSGGRGKRVPIININDVERVD